MADPGGIIRAGKGRPVSVFLADETDIIVHKFCLQTIFETCTAFNYIHQNLAFNPTVLLLAGAEPSSCFSPAEQIIADVRGDSPTMAGTRPKNGQVSQGTQRF